MCADATVMDGVAGGRGQRGRECRDSRPPRLLSALGGNFSCRANNCREVLSRRGQRGGDSAVKGIVY